MMSTLYPVIRLVMFIGFLWGLLPFFYTFKFIKIVRRYIIWSKDDLRGKVVLITGASSGIGEELTYEYAKRGACLVIVARRENLIVRVAENARKLGSPQVVPICADVLKLDDCKRFVEAAINHFGRLDHVLNNAGVSCWSPIEEVTDITKLAPVMDINFWGSIYPTYFAIPHLKRSRGNIFVNASAAAILHPAGLSLYSASKAALVNFYETMRVELAPEISITIATLGLIDSEMTRGKVLNKEGTPELNPEFASAFIDQLPLMSSSACAKAIVDGVGRRDRSVTEPRWCKLLFLLETLCPELMEWANRASYLRLKVKAQESRPNPLPPLQHKSD